MLATLEDGQVKEKYAPLIVDYPLAAEDDTSVVQMGSTDTISQAQLTAAVAAEARARQTADNDPADGD